MTASTSVRCDGPPHARGFTYVGVLLLLALMSTALLLAGTLWSTLSKRDREADLIAIGDQFRLAIIEFHDVVPVGQQARFPKTLDELVLDPRWPTTHRHLRKVFLDPMTGAADWAIEPAPGGGISAVHSRSTGRPLKQSGFSADDRELENADSYAQWRFGYPTESAVPSAASASQPRFSLPSFGPSNSASPIHP